MTEQPDAVVTAVPAQKPSFLSRLKAPIVRVLALTGLVALGAFALGRKSRSDDCACDTDDTATAGTDTTV